MGKIICTGLGPGNPDLMSVRSDRLIRGAGHLAYFRKRGRKGQARRIVDGMLAPGVVEYPMEYPVTTEIPFDSPDYIDALARFYDDWANRLVDLARSNGVVAHEVATEKLLVEWIVDHTLAGAGLSPEAA